METLQRLKSTQALSLTNQQNVNAFCMYTIFINSNKYQSYRIKEMETQLNQKY